MRDEPIKITAEDVHNWSAPHIQMRWRGKLTQEQQYLLTGAEIRHHQYGTSAQEEADKINEAFAEMF